MRVFGICGKSKGSRRELVAELVARLRMTGMRVAIVKRAPICFDMDEPGTDSYRQRESGCSEMIIASDRRMVLMEEYRPDVASPSLGQLIGRLKPCDIVIAINFRDEAIPRVEIIEDDPGGRGERNAEWIVARVMRDGVHFRDRIVASDDYDTICEHVLAGAVALKSGSGEIKKTTTAS